VSFACGKFRTSGLAESLDGDFDSVRLRPRGCKLIFNRSDKLARAVTQDTKGILHNEQMFLCRQTANLRDAFDNLPLILRRIE
jgi:hypothetical protein